MEMGIDHGRDSRPVLAISSVSKSLGATRAVRDVSFELKRGQIVALLGENGAGKSTLLSILAGLITMDGGSVSIEGRPARLGRAGEAIRSGIGLVHQHLSLIPTFTVREQLALAGWRGRGVPEYVGDGISESDRIELLEMGQRQRVEIAKALVLNPRIFLLDEPTSILAPPEVQELFATLRLLRGQGMAVVIVTHKLREALALADRVLVMAKGQLVLDQKRPEAGWSLQDEHSMLEAMFGQGSAVGTALVDEVTRVPASTPRLAVRGLESPSVHDIGFSIDPGELVTVVGIDGQGQRQLAEALTGYTTAQGSIRLDGEEIGHLGTEQRARKGIALLVDDRVGEASVPLMSIEENVALKRSSPRFNRFERALSLIERWGVAPANPRAPMRTLSGGNMQRVLLGRELDLLPRLLIAINPVHGLDHRTSGLVWQRLRERCAQGGSIIVFTGDLDEAIEHGDRIAVMRDGRLSSFVEAGAASRHSLGAQMVNGW
jgi:simple sugar transport system ATP-binding protein